MDWSQYTSRKVILGGIAVLLVAGAWVVTHWLTIAGQYYGTMVTGICALYATYCGANAAQDHIFTRTGTDIRDKDEDGAAEDAKPAPKAAAKPQPRPPVQPLPED